MAPISLVDACDLSAIRTKPATEVGQLSRSLGSTLESSIKATVAFAPDQVFKRDCQSPNEPTKLIM
jgi:hypothetical protein